ncbi:ABC transporter permease [Spiroplasma sp. SV19]|uniref:ABC transporter permease n=1 Tax=Spiroplasma sp. SV19 TaxID=2570468 RepID=UPI0024B6C8EB|nr:ABC transporter permease [Spiroplasma sp. SV19]WHQ36341.1 hypothetical protein E7Y35_00030 [Spiroplasma sp. SV19]
MITINSQDKVQELITSEIQTDANTIQKYYETKINLLYDRIYYLALIKNKRVAKYEQKIAKINQQKEMLTAKIIFQWTDHQLTQTEYEQVLSNLKTKFAKNQQPKIVKIKNQKEKYLNAYDTKISVKINHYKTRIKGYQEQQSKMLLKLAKKKDLLIKRYLTNQEQKWSQYNVKQEQKFNKKINNNYFNMKLQKLEMSYKEQQIGPLTYQNTKTKLEQKKIVKKEQYQNSESWFNNFTFKKMKIIMNANFMFGPTKLLAWQDRIRDILRSARLIIIVAIFAIVVGIINNIFFSSQNWINILKQNVDLGVIAIGMTLVILTGGIDLSVGSLLAMSGALSAMLIVKGIAIGYALLSSIIFATLIGILSGFFVGYSKLQPFIVTLIMMLIMRGAAYVTLKSNTIALHSPVIDFIGLGNLGALPFSIFLFLIIAIITYIVTKFYKYGRYLYAVGSNEKAALLSGIRVNLIKLSTYALSGLLTGVAMLLYLGRVGAISPADGNGWELNAIAAVVLGGTSLAGGKGGILNTIVGWLTLSILSNALILIDINPNVQLIIKGLVILLAVLLDRDYPILVNVKTYYQRLFYRF